MRLPILICIALALASPAWERAHGEAADGLEEMLPELAGTLEREREFGIVCTGLLKSYGGPAEQFQGRLAYAKARLAFNAAIETVVVALETDRETLVIDTALQQGIAEREALCNLANAVLPDLSETKNPLVALLAAAVGESPGLLSTVMEWRGANRDAMRARRTALIGRLETKKWPDYDDIEAQR